MNLLSTTGSGHAGPAWRTSALARNSEWLQTAFLLLLSALFVWHFVEVHATHPLGAGSVLPATAWLGWADQAAYYVSARGWATGDLDAAHHLYPAGYALLAAPFFRWFPDDPFYVPNILCWIASLWLFAHLAARLGLGPLRNRAAGGLVFFLVTTVSSRVFYSWEIPWTSTLATVLVYAALLATLLHVERITPGHAMLAAGLAGMVALVRPTDAMVIMTGVGLAILVTAIRPVRLRVLVAAAAGFGIGPAALVATHVLTHGWVLGYYFENSRLIGFEWRLLPLHWVTLVLSPEPLFDSGDGIAAFFPYLLPGLAGVLACLFAGRRLSHAIAGGAAVAVTLLYLSYRDLHVQGLNQFLNYHYFKWALPLFALYAANLAHLVLTWRWVAALPAIAVVASLSFWRADLARDSRALPARISADGRAMTVPGGLPHIDQAVLVRAQGDFMTIYLGPHDMQAETGRLIPNADFKLYPVPNGLMLTPLRPLPGPLMLHFGAPLQLDPTTVPVAARQRIKFGLPCIVLTMRATCQYLSPLQPSP